MTTAEYFEMYSYLTADLRMDTDEAKCVMSDIEATENIEMDCWELLEELV